MKSINVLLIEDSPSYALLVRLMLGQVKAGAFEIECAESLSVGLHRLAEGGIDALLLDLTLPDSQGLDTFTHVRNRARGVPIVVLTSVDDETLAFAALQHGAADYLVKGEVNGNWIARSLVYAIERHRAEEGPCSRPRLDEAIAQHCLKVEQAEDVAIVRFLDEKIVSLTTLEEMKRQLYRLVDQARSKKLLVDFCSVEYVSDAAIGILLRLHKKATAIGGNLILCNVSPEVFEHFSSRRFNQVFDIRADEGSALKAFEW